MIQTILLSRLAAGLTFLLTSTWVPSADQATRSEPLTARNALIRMSPGLNFGNTLEAIPNETSWGNPPASDAFMAAVKKAGFRSIRIPVAWSQYADPNNQISPKWMSHVTDVVKQATQAGLYVMINIHWDGGWMQPTSAKQPTVNAKLRKFWTQIAKNFRDFDDHLLFAGTNEVHVDGVYSPPTEENVTVQNGFNQIFVDAVRATGGKNASRFLVVQAYNTDIDNAVKVNAKLPTDTAKGRLMMEVHYYSPYDFTLNEKSNIWQWGKTATDPAATETWANEAFVDGQFEKLKSAFVDKGVPVILGEYAAGMKPKFPEMNAYRLRWDEYVTRSAYEHGAIPMYWDIGTDHGLINRTTGTPQDPELIRLLIEACKGR